ncbi:MarR family transcriptional regulator [Aestuariicella hydrocarbonica]|uniref:MarR family transcriptional regulator n=1 Tax=Pseudomaricurvus hydrocarbonicus TaxID=1470433 RepID=A0A9E5JU39_9GAMM|nr:MarR family transcriptional regulator [Aestuariicella hydrocarbonica]NHO64590.1 MarR family transcriptional regulator [Aestuariicella hydrocarbonica]
MNTSAKTKTQTPIKTQANISRADTHLDKDLGLTSQGLVAHLIAVTHFVQKSTQDRLMASQRYEKLSLSYEGYISLLAEQDHSPGELAAKLGISKQACSKVIRELETLDYIERRKHPQDSRSSLLSLSAKGRQLLQDGVQHMVELQHEFASKVGEERLQELIGLLEALCRIRKIELPELRVLESTMDGEHAGSDAFKSGSTRLNQLSSVLNREFRRALFTSLSDKGFQGLRANLGQVLGLISQEGQKIQYIASVTGVSKQAVAVTAAELEQQGYIVREPDPTDKRQVILRLSPLGSELLVEILASVRELEASIHKALGDDKYRALEETLATLYLEVAAQHGSMGALPGKIRQLSEELLAELGAAGAYALAQRLMTITRGKM